MVEVVEGRRLEGMGKLVGTASVNVKVEVLVKVSWLLDAVSGKPEVLVSEMGAQGASVGTDQVV